MTFSFKKIVLGVVACALALAPFRFAVAQGAHGGHQASRNGVLTPFECSPGEDAFAGFVNLVTHGLHFLVLQASVGSDSDNAAGGFVTVPGQLFTGFGFDIDHCYRGDFLNPVTFVTGDDEFGDAVFAGYFCLSPTTETTLSNGFTRKFWAPDAAFFGSGIPLVSNTVVITLEGEFDGPSDTVNIMNVRVNGRATTNNLRGLQGCSVFNGTDF